MSNALKLVIAIIVVVVVWKVVLPKLNKGSSSSKTSSSSPGGDCVQSAEAASEAWGRGLGRFANPPYDLSAWSSFRGEVDSKISTAISDCDCAEDSCRKVSGAMRDLRSLVSEMDGAIRNGSSPPDDVVQRQEQIDNQINEAR